MIVEAQGEMHDDVPLCVDLDGTLLKSDLLYESVIVLLRNNPLYVFLLPIWLFRGKAVLKEAIAKRVSIDPDGLPFDQRVVDLVTASPNRHRVLCTATDQRLADAIASHLGIFDLVLASNGMRNLAGSHKAEALVARFGERGFDYVGNGQVDLDIWRRARRAWVVNGPKSLAEEAGRHCTLETHLPAEAGEWRAWLKAVRVHQWLKNLLIFVPLLASHRFFEVGALADAGLAFLAFGLCASGVYVLNDLVDLPADRLHPRKRHRPFAAGRLPVLHGMIAAPVLTLAGFVIALLCGPLFAAVLALYYVSTLAYSLWLKRVVMLDVMLLAGLYTTRIIAGAAAIGAGLSFWLLAFSMFLFLSLAMLKRYTELATMLSSGRTTASGRGYGVDDLPLIQSLGSASGYLAVLVFALYINSPESIALYSRPEVLWLLCPVLLYWISRTWVIAHRGEMDDDPVVFAVTDRVSQAVLVIFGLIVILAI